MKERKTPEPSAEQDKDLDNTSLEVTQAEENSAEETVTFELHRDMAEQKNAGRCPTGTGFVLCWLFACCFGLNIF